MNREREKQIESIFRNYKRNKKELAQDYNIPVPSGVSYDKVSVQNGSNRNPVEEMTVEYISKREDLSKKVFIVDEVLTWFRLEGHGRDRFVRIFLIEGSSWVKTSVECHICRNTLFSWRREVLEKAETVAKWINFF